EASPVLERALRLLDTAPRAGDLLLLKTLNALADVTQGEGDTTRAEALFRRAVGIAEAVPDDVWRERVFALNGLGLVRHARGQLEESKYLFTRALAAADGRPGPGDPTVARILFNLAAVYSETGQASYARSLYRRAVDIDASLAPPQLARVLAVK